MKKRSFTLIELLIVIAIIAILMAMLLPALNKARASAAKTVCQGKLKQMALGFSSYASDCDDWLIPTWKNYPANVNDQFWVTPLSNYIDKKWWQTSPTFSCGDVTGRAYAKNAESNSGGKYTQFKNISTKIVVVDSNGGDAWCLAFYPSTGDTNKNGYAKRHLNGANALYLDGHTGYLDNKMCDYTRSKTSIYFKYY